MTVDAPRLEPDQTRTRLAGRGWLGTTLALAGAVLSFLGWYGVSGTATVGEQLPYLASGSIPGAALIVAAAIVLARESGQRTEHRTDALIAELHSLLVQETAASATTRLAEPTVPSGALVVVPGGGRYHRAMCALVVGKSGVEEIDAAAAGEQHLLACPVCEPDKPAA